MILAAGLGRLRLLPETFWALTLPEFMAMTGLTLAAGFAPGRQHLLKLMQTFPDGDDDGG